VNLKDGASRLKLRLCPEIAMLDFEAAVTDAYLFHFSDITIKLIFIFIFHKIFTRK
jgi:hypothetical protein